MRRRPAFGLAALGLVWVLGLGGCGKEEAEPVPVRPVLTVVAAPNDDLVFGPFVGAVEPRYRSQLGFQIGGRMVARDVTIGDVVRKGQRLAALDPTVTRFDLTRAEADLADATAQAENAKAAEARARTLIASNNIAQAQLDAAVARRDTADARLAQARAALQKARDQVGYTELKADFDGVVTQRLAEIGQVLAPGQAVVTVARPETREAVVDIPEDLVGEMPADGIFTVRLESVPEITVQGRVRETTPFAEANTRTRRIRMTLIEPSPAFRLGATITVFLSRHVERRYRLPATALLDDGGRRSVWIVTGGKPDGAASVTRRDVTMAAAADGDGQITVTGGLSPGDRVVVAGVHSLTDGQAVRLAEKL